MVVEALEDEKLIELVAQLVKMVWGGAALATIQQTHNRRPDPQLQTLVDK